MIKKKPTFNLHFNHLMYLIPMYFSANNKRLAPTCAFGHPWKALEKLTYLKLNSCKIKKSFHPIQFLSWMNIQFLTNWPCLDSLLLSMLDQVSFTLTGPYFPMVGFNSLTFILWFILLFYFFVCFYFLIFIFQTFFFLFKDRFFFGKSHFYQFC